MPRCHSSPPPTDQILRLVKGDPVLQENGEANRDPPVVGRTGGAGGFSLYGRAAALYNFFEDTEAARLIFESLRDSRVLSRTSNGYLLTFSGLGGGTGSGSVPVVVQWMQDAMRNSGEAPVTTLSVCIVPEQQHGSDNPDPRNQYNLLASLYYLSKTPAINGVILADNLLLHKQGHSDLVFDVNTYLQDALMPVFLAAQSAYHFISHGTQMDPADVRNTLAPRGDGHHEFIAAGFSVFPMGGASRRIRAMDSHTVTANVGKVPDIKDMLHKALESTTIHCDPISARSVLALLSGPAKSIKQMVPDNPSRIYFQDYLRTACISQTTANASGFARFFMADFPRMTDVRLTVLLGGCGFPHIENNIRRALDDDPLWNPEQGDSLADALRRLPESLVVDKGMRFMPSGE